MTRTLHLERPSFWTETRDPEAWFRALDVLSRAEQSALKGTPRAVWDHALAKTLSRRTALGLFGAAETAEGALLYGTGLMAWSPVGWQLNEEAAGMLARWQSAPSAVLEELARFLVRESAWIRCLLCRLQDGDWELADWRRVRGGRRGLKPGESLLLHRSSEPREWLVGLEQRVGARWLARTGCSTIAVHPEVLARGTRRDDLSLAPLTAPLHLFEALGWLSADGALRLPAELRAELSGQSSAADVLSRISLANADVRGFVAVEPVLRELLSAFGTPLTDEDFARWMDGLVQASKSTGAIEILAAEPGQARHGRGLFGDPARKLVRWVIHDEFNKCFQQAWAALGSNPNVRSQHPEAHGEERTR